MENSQGKCQRASSSDSEDIPRPDPKRAFTSAIGLHPVAETIATGKSLDDLDAKMERVIQGQDAMNQRMQNLAQGIARVVDSKLNCDKRSNLSLVTSALNYGMCGSGCRRWTQHPARWGCYRCTTGPAWQGGVRCHEHFEFNDIPNTTDQRAHINRPGDDGGLVVQLSRFDQLQIQVEVTSAERIGSTDRGRNKNRPVAVTFRTDDGIRLVMKNKWKLKDNATYSAVYIDHDKPRDIRSMEANIWRLVKKMPNIEIRRGRVVSKPNPDAENNVEA